METTFCSLVWISKCRLIKNRKKSWGFFALFLVLFFVLFFSAFGNNRKWFQKHADDFNKPRQESLNI